MWRSVGAIAAGFLTFFLCFAGQASAADLYAPSLKDGPYEAPGINWTGLYLGIHGGYATGDWDGRLETTAGCPNNCPPNKDAGYTDPTRSINGDGGLVGIDGGYNWQRPSSPFVLGIEADIAWTDFNGSGTFATDKYNPSVWSKRHDLSLDYFGTVRGRIGYTIGSVMPFVTGGFAWGKTSGDLAVTYIPPPPQAGGGTSHASVDETHTGWTVGAGLEWRTETNWSVKAQWLHVDLGDEAYLFKGKTYLGGPFDTDSFRSSLVFDTFTVGLNYHF
jgi:outer membrane immunogenic protein